MPNSNHINILLVDNYDSFTFNLNNLVLSYEEISLSVRRNDENFISKVESREYDGAIIGPGPGSAEDESYFGYNKELILNHGQRGFPILGVCLGFQGIYYYLGGKLKLGKEPVHGKVSELCITQQGALFQGVPQRAAAMRYHSIIADTCQIPDDIELTSYPYLDDKINVDLKTPMSLEHKKYPIYGVQFHPESFATIVGGTIMQNFINVCRGIKFSNKKD